MSKGELTLFLSMFEDYCRHFRENKNSLMTKILGVFTVKSGKMGDIHIMLMENDLKFKEPEQIKYVFDLKGSSIARKVKGKTKNTTTLKDVNYLMTAEANQGLTMMKSSVKKRLR